MIHMAKFTVTVTEIYCKAFEIETADAETAEALIQGQWDQGEIEPTDGGFDHVEIAAEQAEGVPHGADAHV
jgi:hypothetical protein